MVTPRKADILRRAQELAMRKDIMTGLPGTTSTEFELKETGMFQEARMDLMGSGLDEPIGKSEAKSEQLHYLDVMAQEMKLRVIPKTALRDLQRKTGFEWTNGWTEHKKRERKAKTVVKKEKERKKLEKYVRDQQKRRKLQWISQAKKDALAKKRQKRRDRIPVKAKKRKRLHVGRNGKKPRKLKGFVFGDDVWKVRKPRRRGAR